MPRPRRTIARLMVAVAVVAVGIAVLRNATDLVASSVFALAGLSFVIATLGACVGRGPAWAGFAVFGWGWLLLNFGFMSTPWPRPVSGILVDALARPPFFTPPPTTTTFLVPGRNAVMSGGNYMSVLVTTAPTGVVATEIGFSQVAQSLLALAFAWLGSYVGRRLAPRTPPPPPNFASPPVDKPR